MDSVTMNAFVDECTQRSMDRVSMSAFTDECSKLAADKVTMSAFVNECTKLAGITPGKVKSFVDAHKGALKAVGIGGGSIAAFLAGKQAKDDYVLGRRMRKQYQKRQ